MNHALHHHGQPTTAATLDRTVSDADVSRVRSWLERAAPELNGALAESCVCMYTNTPDQDFLLDWLPGSNRVFIASACSGHGFKFAPALGEMVAHMLDDERPPIDPEPFAFKRFGD